jgi:hypothetical protein
VPRKERRHSPRPEIGRTGAALRREIHQLKQQSTEILLRMDELLRELEAVEVRASSAARAKK